MLDARLGQRSVERGVVRGSDVGVVPRLQRRGSAPRSPGSAASGPARRCARPGAAVEADRAREAVARGRGEPRVTAAEAEADDEDRRARAALLAAEELDRRPCVRLDAVGRRLRDVIHVREVVVALRDARGAAEIVDRDGRVTALGEAQRELLVEVVQPADVGKDDDPRPARLVGKRGYAANRLPSAASSVRSSERTGAPPERAGIGGTESSSKHMVPPLGSCARTRAARRLRRSGAPRTR